MEDVCVAKRAFKCPVDTCSASESLSLASEHCDGSSFTPFRFGSPAGGSSVEWSSKRVIGIRLEVSDAWYAECWRDTRIYRAYELVHFCDCRGHRVRRVHNGFARSLRPRLAILCLHMSLSALRRQPSPRRQRGCSAHGGRPSSWTPFPQQIFDGKSSETTAKTKGGLDVSSRSGATYCSSSGEGVSTYFEYF